MEVAMSTSMTSYLTITKAIIEECQVGKQMFCDHPMTILHKMYVDIHALRVHYDTMDVIHSNVIFEKVDDSLPNVEKQIKDWVEKYASAKQAR